MSIGFWRHCIVVGAASLLAHPWAQAAPSCTSEVTQSSTLKQSGYRLNRRESQYVQTIQVTNSTASPIEGQIYVALDGLTSGVTLNNSEGLVNCPGGPVGAPYAKVGNSVSGTILPGEKRSLVLQFSNPSNKAIRYTPRVFAGGSAGTATTGVTIEPDGVPVNTNTLVTVLASVPYPAGGEVPTVVVQRLDASGNVVGTDGTMVDNGNLGAGDEIGGDGVFTLRRTYNLSSPGDIRLRIQAQFGGQTGYSEPFTLTAFVPITDGEAQAMVTLQQSAKQQYDQLLGTKSPEEARAVVVAALKSDPSVLDAGSSAGQFWISYRNGMRAVVLLIAGTKGGGGEVVATPPQPAWNDLFKTRRTMSRPAAMSTAPKAGSASSNIEVQSKRVLLLSPFVSEFGGNDEGSGLNTLYSSQSCPAYDGSSGKPVYLENAAAGVGSFKALGSYGIVHISSHGTVDQGTNKVIILTGTSSSAANVKTYQTDLQKGRLVMSSTAAGATVLSITPDFITHYIKSFPDSLVFLSACETTKNDTMVKALMARGARAVLGFSETIDSNVSFEKANYFHKAWIEDPDTLVTSGEVYNNGVSPGFPRCNANACWDLVGTNVTAPSGNQLQNGGFESGTLGAWAPAGDGRVVSQLGTYAPTDGQYAAVVSTGLGFTTSSGSIEQKVCLPNAAKTLTFDWNFSSEEFREYCGSIYQDYFRVDVVDAGGMVTNLYYQNVDQLCAATVKVPFSFDRGDVWSTGWLSTSIDISGIVKANAGKTVTLRFSAGDVGDSIYDTAVLLDAIGVK